MRRRSQRLHFLPSGGLKFALFARVDEHRFSGAADLWEYLCARSDRELQLARRVLAALFDTRG